MYRKALWFGLGLVVCGAIASIVAYSWEVPYGGPLTGLGPALLLLAAFAVMALGALVALVSFIMGAASGARHKQRLGDSSMNDGS